MEMARGARVAFLTQDAVPADESWLAALMGGFDGEDVGSGLRPLPAASGREPDGRARAARSGSPPSRRSPAGRSGANAGARARTRSSRARTARLAAAAWERVPFRDVPYAEDQRLAVDMLNAGFSKAFVPAAGVVHSHDYPLGERFRRWFDEFRALREVYGYRAPLAPRPVLAGSAARSPATGRRRATRSCGSRSAITPCAHSAPPSERAQTACPPASGACARSSGAPPTNLRTRELPAPPRLRAPPDPAVSRPAAAGRSDLAVPRSAGDAQARGAVPPAPHAARPAACAWPPGTRTRRAGAYRWYRRHGRKVAIVIPTYGPPDYALAAVKSIRATTRRHRVRIIVADDGRPAGARGATRGRARHRAHPRGGAARLRRERQPRPEGGGSPTRMRCCSTPT